MGAAVEQRGLVLHILKEYSADPNVEDGDSWKLNRKRQFAYLQLQGLPGYLRQRFPGV